MCAVVYFLKSIILVIMLRQRCFVPNNFHSSDVSPADFAHHQ